MLDLLILILAIFGFYNSFMLSIITKLVKKVRVRGIKISVDLKPKIPMEPEILIFGTEVFSKFQYQSFKVPIPMH